MSEDFIVSLLAAAITMGTPLLYAALGEVICERSGVINLGVEGMMLIGACTGFIAGNSFGSPWAGVAAAVIAGALLALIHAFLTVTLRANQVVSGLAVTLFGTGLSGYLGQDYVGQPAGAVFGKIAVPLLSDIPIIGSILFKQDALVYISYFLVPFAAWYFYKTRSGLFLRAMGENPAAVDAAGINVFGLRYLYIVIGGALAGVAGAYLSLAYAPSWLENMTAGRGFIALAAVIFGRWSGAGVLLACLFFGFCDALQIRLQVGSFGVPYQFFQMIPYIATVVVLAGIGMKKAGPKSSGKPYLKEER